MEDKCFLKKEVKVLLLTRRVCFPVVSLRSKHFLARFVWKAGARAKKKMNDLFFASALPFAQ